MLGCIKIFIIYLLLSLSLQRAVQALNTLQTNAAVLEDIRRHGGRRSAYEFARTGDYLRRADIEVCCSHCWTDSCLLLLLPSSRKGCRFEPAECHPCSWHQRKGNVTFHPLLLLLLLLLLSSSSPSPPARALCVHCVRASCVLMVSRQDCTGSDNAL